MLCKSTLAHSVERVCSGSCAAASLFCVSSLFLYVPIAYSTQSELGFSQDLESVGSQFSAIDGATQTYKDIPIFSFDDNLHNTYNSDGFSIPLSSFAPGTKYRVEAKVRFQANLGAGIRDSDLHSDHFLRCPDPTPAANNNPIIIWPTFSKITFSNCKCELCFSLSQLKNGSNNCF